MSHWSSKRFVMSVIAIAVAFSIISAGCGSQAPEVDPEAQKLAKYGPIVKGYTVFIASATGITAGGYPFRKITHWKDDFGFQMVTIVLEDDIVEVRESQVWVDESIDKDD